MGIYDKKKEKIHQKCKRLHACNKNIKVIVRGFYKNFNILMPVTLANIQSTSKSTLITWKYYTLITVIRLHHYSLVFQAIQENEANSLIFSHIPNSITCLFAVLAYTCIYLDLFLPLGTSFLRGLLHLSPSYVSNVARTSSCSSSEPHTSRSSSNGVTTNSSLSILSLASLSFVVFNFCVGAGVGSYHAPHYFL